MPCYVRPFVSGRLLTQPVVAASLATDGLGATTIAQVGVPQPALGSAAGKTLGVPAGVPVVPTPLGAHRCVSGGLWQSIAAADCRLVLPLALLVSTPYGRSYEARVERRPHEVTRTRKTTPRNTRVYACSTRGRLCQTRRGSWHRTVAGR